MVKQIVADYAMYRNAYFDHRNNAFYSGIGSAYTPKRQNKAISYCRGSLEVRDRFLTWFSQAAQR